MKLLWQYILPDTYLLSNIISSFNARDFCMPSQPNYEIYEESQNQSSEWYRFLAHSFHVYSVKELILNMFSIYGTIGLNRQLHVVPKPFLRRKNINWTLSSSQVSFQVKQHTLTLMTFLIFFFSKKLKKKNLKNI